MLSSVNSMLKGPLEKIQNLELKMEVLDDRQRGEKELQTEVFGKKTQCNLLQNTRK